MVKKTVADFQSPRVQTIVQLAKQGAPLEVMGKAIGGVTRERARQVVNEIEEVHGVNVYNHRRNWLSVQRVAKNLRCPDLFVRRCVKSGEAELAEWRQRVGGPYFLTPKGVAQVKRKLQKAKNRKCANCGQEFRVRNPFSPRKFCKKKACQHSQSSYVLKGPVKYSIGWLGAVRQKLSQHILPKPENWLTYSQARELTQLTPSQFMNLVRTKSFRTRLHPKRRWKGRKATLYAQSELLIVRACWDEVRKKREK